MQFQRYAIYVVPDGNALAEFGASWLGWDAAKGVRVAHPPTGLPLDKITQTPGKYGFHGTVHWPFALRDPTDQGVARMLQVLAAFCATRAPLQIEGLKLARLGRFLALVPEGDTSALVKTAAELVQKIQPLRAAPTGTEIARRRTGHLNPEQDALLTRWGYPYVMDQFRFHMTLTGKLPKTRLAEVEAVLNTLLPSILPRCFDIEALCLMGEDHEGKFHVIKRLPFGGGF